MKLRQIGKKNHRLQLLVTILFVLGTGNQFAVAQLSSWINNTGGLYETPTNWSAPVIPPPTNDVTFGFPGEYSVGFQEDHTSGDLSVSFESHPTFSIAGDQSTDRIYSLTSEAEILDEASLTLESGAGPGRFHMDVTGRVHVGGHPQISDAGLLTIRDGATLASGAGTLGEFANTTGRVHVTGNLTEWDFGSDLFVGLEGRGELTIDAGASIFGGGTTTSFANGDSSSAVVNVTGVGTDGMLFYLDDH